MKIICYNTNIHLSFTFLLMCLINYLFIYYLLFLLFHVYIKSAALVPDVVWLQLFGLGYKWTYICLLEGLTCIVFLFRRIRDNDTDKNNSFMWAEQHSCLSFYLISILITCRIHWLCYKTWMASIFNCHFKFKKFLFNCILKSLNFWIPNTFQDWRFAYIIKNDDLKIKLLQF